MIPHEMTVRADVVAHVESRRRYNFKMREGNEELIFSAQVRDLKCRDDGYRRLRFRGVRVSAATVPLTSILRDDPMAEIPA